jgi:hypothetical protein
VRITDPLPVDEETARAERQAEWSRRAAETARASRQSRLRRLQTGRDAVRYALEAYRALDDGHRPMIALRQGFVYLADPRPTLPDVDTEAVQDPKERTKSRLTRDIETRPPLTKLVNRKTNALSLLLTTIYIAHLECQPGRTFRNVHRNAITKPEAPSWATLAGLGATSLRTRRVRVTRALHELADAGLVEIGTPGERDRFEGFWLNREDGTQTRYTPPGEHAAEVVVLPASFFLNGWHLVLEPKEIAALLAIVELTNRILGSRQRDNERGVALPRSVRWTRYGLSGEVYEAVHELDEFGLIDIRDTMPRRRRGKLKLSTQQQREYAERHGGSLAPEPYQFVYDTIGSAFQREAARVVLGSLKANPLPPRMTQS